MLTAAAEISLEDFPDEILLQFFYNLSPIDIIILARTDKNLSRFINPHHPLAEQLWQIKLDRHFPKKNKRYSALTTFINQYINDKEYKSFDSKRMKAILSYLKENDYERLAEVAFAEYLTKIIIREWLFTSLIQPRLKHHLAKLATNWWDTHKQEIGEMEANKQLNYGNYNLVWNINLDLPLAIIEPLIQPGENINEVSAFYPPPLCIAARRNRVDIADLLIKKGTNVNVINRSKQTALHIASNYGHFDVVKLLVEKKSLINKPDEKKETPLMAAAKGGHLSVMQYLCEQGADITLTNQDERTALHLAVQGGNLEIVKLLVCEKNLDIHQVDVNRQTPFWLAAQTGFVSVMQFLHEQGAVINMTNKKNKTPLYTAAKMGHLQAVQYLVDKNPQETNREASYSKTPLYAAAKNGHFHVVQYLCEHGAAMDKIHEELKLYKHVLQAHNLEIAQYLLNSSERNRDIKDFGRTLLHYFIKYNNLDLVKLAVENGINVNQPDNYGQTALIFLSQQRYRNLEIAEYLIEKGAKLNHADQNGFTPLSMACEKNNLELVKYLIEQGTDAEYINEKDDYKNTLLHIAAAENHLDLLKYLIDKIPQALSKLNKYGWSVFHCAAGRGHQQVMQFLCEHDTHQVEVTHETKLCIAAELGHLEIVKILVAKNPPNINKPDYLNRSPLWRAVENNKYDVVKYLVEHGADINQSADLEQTPLGIAANKGHLDIIKYLVEQKADINKADCFGKKPFKIAAENNNLNCQQYLHELTLDLVKKNVKFNNSEATQIAEFFMYAYNKQDFTSIQLIFEQGANKHWFIDLLIYALKKRLTSFYELGFKPFLEEKVNLDKNKEKLIVNFFIDAYNNNDFTLIQSIIKHCANKQWFIDLLINVLKKGFIEILTYCFEQGAAVNQLNSDGESLLFVAAENNQLEIVKLLIERKSPIEQANNKGMTPLWIASQNGHFPIVKYLCDHNANIHHKNNDGVTPLIIASNKSRQNIVRFLALKNTIIDSATFLKINLDCFNDLIFIAHRNANSLKDGFGFFDSNEFNKNLPEYIINYAMKSILIKCQHILLENNNLSNFKKLIAIKDLNNHINKHPNQTFEQNFNQWLVLKNSQNTTETNFDIVQNHNNPATWITKKGAEGIASLLSFFDQEVSNNIEKKAPKADTLTFLETLVERSKIYSCNTPGLTTTVTTSMTSSTTTTTTMNATL